MSKPVITVALTEDTPLHAWIDRSPINVTGWTGGVTAALATFREVLTHRPLSAGQKLALCTADGTEVWSAVV